MKENVTYDKKSDSLYIFVKKGVEDHFEEILPGVTIEYNQKNEVIGIEVLNASKVSDSLQKMIK